MVDEEGRPQPAQGRHHQGVDLIMEERASFTRMDRSTRKEWLIIARATSTRQSEVPRTIVAMLGSLEGVYTGFGVCQLHHALQTATMARRANASDEMVLGALCHDIGKAVSVPNHGQIAAEILKPYVSDGVYQVVRNHQDFQGKHYYGYFGYSGSVRDRHRNEPWYAQAERFADEWDQVAFDRKYPVLPLREFEPLVEQVFSRSPRVEL